jgi:dual specificity tyrosine-phosphorylation-regulated kinase 2/3/4
MAVPLINTNQGKNKKSDSLMPNGSCSLRYRNSSNDTKEPQLTDRILAVSLAGKLPLEVVSQNS